jgi:hypothetical protein
MPDPVAELKSFFLTILKFLLLILSVLWIFTTLYLIVDIIHQAFPNAQDEQSPKAALEMGFYLVNMIVLPLGLAALVIARGHAKELENTRQGAVYMSIVDKWNSTLMVTSRKLIYDLRDEYSDKKQQSDHELGDMTQGEYISNVIFALGENRKLMEHREHISVLYYFEDLGILCRKNYIRKDDVYNFIGENITTLVEFLIPYIKAERELAARENPKNPNIRALYANALYLYNGAINHAPQFHTEELPPRDSFG